MSATLPSLAGAGVGEAWMCRDLTKHHGTTTTLAWAQSQVRGHSN